MDFDDLLLNVLEIGVDMKDRLKLLWHKLLGKDHNQNCHYEQQRGFLIVSKTGETEIKIPCHPNHFSVEFSDNQILTPCNHHHDKVSCTIKKIHGHYLFVISWHVSGVREIKWVIKY